MVLAIIMVVVVLPEAETSIAKVAIVVAVVLAQMVALGETEVLLVVMQEKS